MEELRDTDGMRLLYMEQVAALRGVKPSTVRAANTAAHRHRRQHKATVFDLPAPRKKVRRKTVKSDGQPLVVWTPVWREDDIRAWLGNMRGPGGKARILGGQPVDDAR